MIIPAPRVAPTEATRRWATLLQQIFEVDPLACPSCHGAMRIVAFITQTSVIDQILTHLRTHASREAHAGPRSPPSTRRIGPRRHRAPHGARRSQPPFPTAVPTALEAHERVGGPAATRQSVLVRAVIASYTQPTQIEIPIPVMEVLTCQTFANVSQKLMSRCFFDMLLM